MKVAVRKFIGPNTRYLKEKFLMKLDLYQKIKGIDASKWHPKFKILMNEGLHLSGEKSVVSNWTEGFVDRDKKIIKEFQTTFHSSFWEFYLFALFKDAGFTLDQTNNRPDFIIKSPAEIYVEAVVSNIKDGGKKEDERNLGYYMSMFTPPYMQLDFYDVLDEAIIRHSNAITKKNKMFIEGYRKCEWIHPENPFVIAISSYAQINYGREYIYPMLALLYGLYYHPETDSFIKKSCVIKKDTNAEIPIGIFNNSKYDSISAIIYSCTTTLGKLTSLMISSGNPSMNVVYNIRKDDEDFKIPYKLQIVNSDSPEVLSDGIFVFHNPNAKHKIPVEYFETTNATQYFIKEDKLIHTSNTFPIVARLNISVVLKEGFEMLIQENLRAYNQVSVDDFYDIKLPEEKKKSFDVECSVCIIGKSNKNNQTMVFHYERPQFMHDDILTKEANKNFEDMKKRKLHNVDELLAIYIARTQEQYDSI